MKNVKLVIMDKHMPGVTGDQAEQVIKKLKGKEDFNESDTSILSTCWAVSIPKWARGSLFDR